jgi:predicted DNA-binding transcriptional regulator AlpA
MEEQAEKKFVTVKDVAALLACSRPTVYRIIKQDENFPEPDRRLPKMKRWLYEDVQEWYRNYKG